MVVDVYVSVGSNIAPEENVLRAFELLALQLPVVQTSTMYRTKALGRPWQADFVNGVWHVRTDLEPRVVKYSVLRGIETALGRVRSEDAYADRPIDLDILVYGDCVVSEAGLRIPDPDILDRPFLAIPLLELEPDIVLPGFGIRLAEHPVTRNTTGLEPMIELTKELQRRLKT